MDVLALSDVTQLSTVTKFDNLLVMLDRYSQYTLFMAMPTNDTTTHMINAYYQCAYLYLESLENIVSYQDTIFTSGQWLQF